MAIYHLSVDVIRRAAGRSVVAAAAYRAGTRLWDERLGRACDYLTKLGVVHSEILLPDGAPARWADRATLWNEVEQTERWRKAQLARDIEISLPRELSPAEAVTLVREYVLEQFVSRGMVADLNLHWATGSDGGLQAHAHVLLTLRRILPGGATDEGGGEVSFGLKEREWNSREVLLGWRERWAEMANAQLSASGYDVRIDHRSLAAQGIPLEPQNKIGPAGARRAGRGQPAERRAEHDAIARRNGDRIAADPRIALDALTLQHSTFTRQDLARLASRHSLGAAQFAQVMARVEACPELVRVGVDGRGRERFSTRSMASTEQAMVASAAALAGRRRHPPSAGRVAAVIEGAARRGVALGEEQKDAVRHITGEDDFALVVGVAGTGKSTMLGVAREAWEAAGDRVLGAALSGIAAENLEAGSGIRSRTLASLEWAWAKGRDQLTSRDVLVVDEAGMVGSRQLERVLRHVREAGAKIVLIGDPEQLQAIEAGAAFRALAERHGAAEIHEVRRQHEPWQREATRELATDRTAVALGRYAQAGMVHGHDDLEGARRAVVAAWEVGRQAMPDGSHLMLSYTRADAAALNQLARAGRRAAGELGPEQVVQTERGERGLAAGDRVMFLRNERGLGAGPDGRGGVAVTNGSLGTVLAIEAGQWLTVRLDGAGPAEAVVTFNLDQYGHIDHGYAATIHKSQGATVDRVHVLASRHMDRHASYVALSRHRAGVTLQYARSEIADGQALARMLSRDGAKDTTVDYAVRPDENAEAFVAFAERRGLHPLAPASQAQTSDAPVSMPDDRAASAPDHDDPVRQAGEHVAPASPPPQTEQVTDARPSTINAADVASSSREEAIAVPGTAPAIRTGQDGAGRGELAPGTTGSCADGGGSSGRGDGWRNPVAGTAGTIARGEEPAGTGGDPAAGDPGHSGTAQQGFGGAAGGGCRTSTGAGGHPEDGRHVARGGTEVGGLTPALDASPAGQLPSLGGIDGATVSAAINAARLRAALGAVRQMEAQAGILASPLPPVMPSAAAEAAAEGMRQFGAAWRSARLAVGLEWLTANRALQEVAADQRFSSLKERAATSRGTAVALAVPLPAVTPSAEARRAADAIRAFGTAWRLAQLARRVMERRDVLLLACVAGDPRLRETGLQAKALCRAAEGLAAPLPPPVPSAEAERAVEALRRSAEAWRLVRHVRGCRATVLLAEVAANPRVGGAAAQARVTRQGAEALAASLPPPVPSAEAERAVEALRRSAEAWRLARHVRECRATVLLAEVAANPRIGGAAAQARVTRQGAEALAASLPPPVPSAEAERAVEALRRATEARRVAQIASRLQAHRSALLLAQVGADPGVCAAATQADRVRSEAEALAAPLPVGRPRPRVAVLAAELRMAFVRRRRKDALTAASPAVEPTVTLGALLAQARTRAERAVAGTVPVPHVAPGRDAPEARYLAPLEAAAWAPHAAAEGWRRLVRLLETVEQQAPDLLGQDLPAGRDDPAALLAGVRALAGPRLDPIPPSRTGAASSPDFPPGKPIRPPRRGSAGYGEDR